MCWKSESNKINQLSVSSFTTHFFLKVAMPNQEKHLKRLSLSTAGHGSDNVHEILRKVTGSRRRLWKKRDCRRFIVGKI